MRLLALAVGLAVSLPLLTGCASQTQTATPSPAAQVRPRSTATLAILTPAPGGIVSGTPLHVHLKLSGAVIVPQTSVNLSPDRGHIHLLLDGRVVSMTYGADQDVTVTPGMHLLQAEFVATDHFPFNPRVIKAVTFTVK